MKKRLTLILAALLLATLLAGCAGGDKDFDKTQEIAVVSREASSGTRSAFGELFGLVVKDANGEKADQTTTEAIQTNSTAVMMTTVAGNPYAIGYVSLGSLNDTVKVLKIEGVEASVANIKNGSYKVSRPFLLATKGTLSEVAQDFLDFILSADGQKVIESEKYIPVSDAGAYSGTKPQGKVVLSGSSSVTPAMEKLKEAYLQVNTGATIEIQQSDSSTGITDALEGRCDIGMSSRTLKESETDAGLNAVTIAMDGIAVIVHEKNPLSDLTKEEVRRIFAGEATEWSAVIPEES